MAKKATAKTEAEIPVESTAEEASPAKQGRGRKSNEIEQHGVRRPSEGTQTRQVWTLIESNLGADGEIPTRATVIDLASKAGINASTASTQYGRFRKFHGLSEERGPRNAPATGAPDAPAAVEGPKAVPAAEQAPAPVEASDEDDDGVVLSDDNDEDNIDD